MTPSQFLKTHAPDFCWCTMIDLREMYRQIVPGICEDSFPVILSGLKRKGYFVYRKGAGRVGFYLRVK